MPEVTSYVEGTPSWVDLTTSDPEGARAFYGSLFGWDFDIGGPDTGHYTMCRLDGRDVAGINGQPAPEGMPPAWTTYLASDDADAMAARIADAGGTVMMGPMDVMEFGRMVIAADPAGAVFGLWQARALIGASLVNEPGAVIWNELATRDLAGVQSFYSAVLGCDWEEEDTGEGGPAYRLLKVGDNVVGGALQMGDEWPREAPSHWTPYFAVADVDAAVASIERLGGGVRGPVTDSKYGRFVAASDPQGGEFTVSEQPPGA
jgi:predicted enzyme related to lactoylglutathione lyase